MAQYRARPKSAHLPTTGRRKRALPPPVPVTEGLVACPVCQGGVRLVKAHFTNADVGIHEKKTLLFAAHRVGGSLIPGNTRPGTKCEGSAQIAEVVA